ncbi:sulfurtransferase TusA family protein [Desulfovibrio sp. OttesenSCG-928-G15]|nr:sulfurtransferase TusA family protein [Desulfovibrio sp. OttesenSCG-928-G15]
MSKTVIDVRGLACPEPLIAFTDAANKSGATEIDISFDCAAAKDNISRAAASLGWDITSVTDAPDHTLMNLTKIS